MAKVKLKVISCFLCSRSSHKEIADLDSGRRKERRGRRRNHIKSKVDFEQSSSSSNPQIQQNVAKRILLKYLVGRCQDEELKGNLLSSNFPIKFCNECKGLAKDVQDLHLQLQIIQMMLIDKLKTVKQRIVQNSVTFREGSEGRSVRNDVEVGNDGEEVTRLIQLGCQFRNFIGNDDTNQAEVPLVFLEKFVGRKTSQEIMSSTSQSQTNQTEFISEQIHEREPRDSSCSTIPLKNLKEPQSKRLLRGDYWAQVKEEPEVDENSAGDDDNSDVDFDPINFQSDSEESSSPPEVSSTSTTGKTGSNSDIATRDKTQMTCEHCGREYANFSKLISHSRLIHRGTKLSCAICPSSDETKLYSLRDELPRHLDDFHGVSSLRLECDFPSCSQRFYNLQNFQRHKKGSHLKIYNKPLLKCNSCSESFRSVYSLAGHQMCVHGHTQLKCELCPPPSGRYFSTPKGLSSHVRLFHLKKAGESEKFPCSKCPKVFALKGARNQHEKLSHGERKFSCDKCGYATTTKGSLVVHSRMVHTSTSIICEICGFTTKHGASLRSHYLHMHDPEYHIQRKMKAGVKVKKFECSVCPKKFSTRSILKVHMLTHTGETPFHCDLCGQAFKRKTTLNFHMLSIHGQGEAKHPCSQCSKRFLNKTRLKLHMSSHTDERKFACDLCGTRFKRNQNLKDHMTNVHAGFENGTRGKYVCEECGKDFYLSNNLKRHLLVHAKGGRTRERKRGVRKQVAKVADVAPSHVPS